MHELGGRQRPSVVLDRGQGSDLKVLLLHREVGAGGLALAGSAGGAAARLLLGVGQDVGLEVGGLSELFAAGIEGTYVGPVARVDSHVSSEIEVQRKSFSASLEGALERFFPSVDQLVALEFTRLDEGFSALGADVDAWPVGVEVFPHRRVVSKHLAAALESKRKCSSNRDKGISTRFDTSDYRIN